MSATEEQSYWINLPENENKGKATRFQPGHFLHPSNDFFVREVIQPAVVEHISNCENWMIQIFSYFNLIIILEVNQLFMWVGVNDLLELCWPWGSTRSSLVIRDICYTLIGFFMYSISIRLFSPSEYNF